MGWKGNDQDPWGSEQPPDLKAAFDKFKRSVPFSKFHFSGRFNIIPVIIGVIVVVWLATGIYFVEPDEVGVVKRFGEAVRTTASGPHYHLPVPIETVMKPKVTQVRRIEIGFRAIGERQVGPNRQVPSESLMLTKSENIVNLTFIVQYKISDPHDYLFNVRDPHQTVKDAAEAAMRETVGESDIDDILTTGKFKIRQDTKISLQKILDGYSAGIAIVAVELQDVHPPEEVMAAFKDVASAKEDRSRMINEAHGYQNEIIPKAKGKAAKIVNEAIAYKESRIIRAEGDASRFTQILEQYYSAKEVTKKRMYIETMEEILPLVEKIIVEGRIGENVLPHLSLGGDAVLPKE